MVKILDGWLDWIWPRYCLNCGHEGRLLCRDCEAGLIVKRIQRCPVCRRGGSPVVCSCCIGQTHLDGLWVALETNELIDNLIYKYKYLDYYNLDIFLAAKAAQMAPPNFDGLITYVPLSYLRLWWRGYNQSQRLAGLLARAMGLEAGGYLRRNKFNRSQVGLNRKERSVNVEGVFAVINPELIKNKNILVVDDVCSSMATLNECARVLKTAGASTVRGLVLVRGT